MSRIARMLRPDESTVYHVISRSALPGFPLGDADIDLNPIRAGIVNRPEEYRWSGLGYLVQTGNRDSLVNLDLGLPEWNDGMPSEVISLYRRFVYETGAMDTGKEKPMDASVVKKEKARDFRLTRSELFAGRCRYFTDSGIIGSKDFVANAFRNVRHLLTLKDTRRFTLVSGIKGVYSMKKLGVG